MTRPISELRREYDLRGLREADLAPDPLAQFERWLQEAVANEAWEPNAMTLATATPDGHPSLRVVLLKGFDQRGFSFFTNYESRKGLELAANPWAALLFIWPELHRQVRVEGTVARVSAEESDDYFRSRPAGSKLGAWASQQGEVLSGREVLEQRMQELAARFQGQEIPRPPYWGGYRLSPLAIEFWQGRPNRLHDRLRYRLEQGAWLIERLAP